MPNPADDLTGRTVGDYVLIRKLGQGGMGQVYLAHQHSLKREVALKILRADLADDPVAVRRFQSEAEAAARLTHPNIVQVFAAGEADGLKFIALEYVDGRTLSDRLTLRGPPDFGEALVLLRQMAEALWQASEAGIVHRDIKPENVLLTRSGLLKIADFGLSRIEPTAGKPLTLTQSGMTLGTPLYMSPEQVQGAPTDHRSDLYSFGVTAFHLLTGKPPFQGATAFEVSVQHVQAIPPNLTDSRPDLPVGLSAILARLLAKKPEHRYQNATEVLADLDRIEQGYSLAKMPALPAAGASLARGRGWRMALMGLALLAAGGGGWWAVRVVPVTQSRAQPLVNVEPPERPTTARERELRAKLKDRAVRPAEHAAATLDLALLLIAEEQWTEADAVFQALEAESRVASRFPPRIAGALGRAIVLAHTHHPDEAIQAVTVVSRASRGLDAALIARPDLAAALADALDECAKQLGTETLPDRVEWLRTPAGVLRGIR